MDHVQGDDNSLVYLRARYYEPSNGRFVSSDQGMDGLNWFIHAGNSPTRFADYSGQSLFYVELGGWTFRFDDFYSESGTGRNIRDFHFFRDGVKGSYRFDGIFKHPGSGPPEEVLEKLFQMKKPQAWLRTAVNGASKDGQPLLGGGGGAEDSVTATFQQDPLFVVQLFLELGWI